MSFNSFLCQQEIPIRDELVKKFKIKSVTGHSFDVVDGKQSTNRFKSYLLTFSHYGYRIRQQKYDGDGRVILETQFDSKGRPQNEITYEISGKISNRFEYIYNHDEYWIEQQMYLSGDELYYKIVSNRDAEGKIIEAIYLTSLGQIIRTDSYNYDDSDNLIKIDMGHMGEWICEYDEDSNLKKKAGNLPSASAFGDNFEFQYNKQGLLIGSNHLNFCNTVFDYTYFD